ncbi:MAG TPA: hypothetical protein VFV27_04550 [Nevskiaceae bacterium]|nr:hypothetical protein [Nevskiaceae bacterium]
MQIRHAAAALLALSLSACGGGGSEEGGTPLAQGATSLFDPVAASAVIPFPNDILYSGATDPTLNLPLPPDTPANAGQRALIGSVNALDGFSTTASIFTDLLGTVDFSTLGRGVLVLNLATGQPLTPGVDYRFQPSAATTPVIPGGPEVPISALRSRVLIEPLRPLAPATRYAVVLTTAVKSVDGVTATPSELFRAVRSATPISQQTDVPILNTLDSTRKATLEAIRTQQVRPLVEGLAPLGIAERDVVLAWTFTTQSIDNTLSRLSAAASARPLGLRNTGLNISQLNPAFPPIANVYAGTVSLPYYLTVPSAENPTAPLSSVWRADGSQPDTSKTFNGVNCGAFTRSDLGLSPSVSTTACFPVPVAQSSVTVPVLLTLPNANSGRTQPANGWPVVIFQHGITRNRSDMLAVAPRLAAAGFAVIAIDLPLHGILPGEATAGLRIPGVAERTFDVDYVSNSSGAPGPDGQPDASGTHFINLSSLLTSRDNLRQAVADLSSLSASLGSAVLLAPNGQPESNRLDGATQRYLGHSLGGIVGTVFLGVNDRVGAATLAMAGGGIAKLLDASKSFGPRIAAGLGAAGVREGTDTYETFLRFAQTAVDATDPLNYGAAAAQRHPIHFLEVIGDLVVPNSTPAGAASATLDRVTVASFLGGTEPLTQVMGLAVQGPLDPPLASPTVLLGEPARLNLVQFSGGDHGSILQPTADADVFTEMQQQMVQFLASNGLCLAIGGSCS